MTGEHSQQNDSPNRWLHLRHRSGYTDLQWRTFQAHCRLFEACAKAHLENWRDLGHDHDAPKYVFFPPQLSEDRTVATLPIGGERTLGSRSLIEDGLANLLWCFMLSCMPVEHFVDLEEGLTEPSLVDPSRVATNWRPAQPHKRH